MPNLTHESFFAVSPGYLFALHARPDALRRLSPAFPPVRVEQDGAFEAGAIVRIEIGIRPISIEWVAEIEQVEPGQRFVDVQKQGPFRSWRHVHRFIPADGGCVMRDEVTWSSRPGFSVLDEIVIRPALSNYFRQRHAALAQWISDEPETQRPIVPTCKLEES